MEISKRDNKPIFCIYCSSNIYRATQWENYFRVEDLLQKKRKTKTEKK